MCASAVKPKYLAKNWDSLCYVKQLPQGIHIPSLVAPLKFQYFDSPLIETKVFEKPHLRIYSWFINGNYLVRISVREKF